MDVVISKYLRQLKPAFYLLLIGNLFNCSVARCQDNVNVISTMFNQYQQNITKEKLFVNTDKNFYITGEILWLKLYDVDATTHQPLDMSKVAYVEIIDSSHQHLLQAKIALKQGEGNGSFYLPASLTSGNYKLRAYTNWMQNFDAAFFFEKNITIVNVQRKLNMPASEPATKIDVQFFPEGGNLVSNLQSKIAFKVTDQYGNGIDFKGFILDNNDTAVTFKPQHEGMGTFVFTPKPNHSYKAFIKTDSGQAEMKNLPVAYNNGCVMSLTDMGDKISVAVESDITSPYPIYLFASTGDNIKISQSNSIQNGKANFVLDKSLLGDGISYVTLFNELRQPICERLYFKKPSQLLNIDANTDQKEYRARQKVKLHIHVASTETLNDTASLSMAVVRLDPLQSQTTPDINAYLLLTSELKGYIKNPGYYFSDNSTETNAALDNLMLTNGWRRFKWDDILKNSNPYFNYVPEYQNPIITASIVNTKTGVAAAGIETYISVPSLQSAFNTSFSDEHGLVKFELKNLYGSSQIILQPNTLHDSTYTININSPFSKDFSTTPYPQFAFHDEKVNALREQSISTQVQNIYAGKSLKHFNKPVIDTAAFYLKPDARYRLDDYTRFTTVEEVLREYVALVDIRKKEGQFHLEVFSTANSDKLKTDPLVLLDGVPLFDFNKLMEINPLKLNTVEVVYDRYFFGNSIFNGIVNWSSYKGDMADYDPGPHAAIIDYDGLQEEREFYSPAYNEAQISTHMPDFRNVLLWSPNIKISGNSNKEIEFYTSDLPGRYLVFIQGLSRSGLAGSASASFSVSSSQ